MLLASRRRLLFAGSRAYTNYVLQQRVPMQDSLVFNSLLVMQWGDLNCGKPYMSSAILFRKAKTP